MTVAIRPYRPGDRADVYDVCVRTGHAGGDARGVYRDPSLLPEIFAGPYLHLEPELAFVAATERRAVGYVIGAADTAAFARRFAAQWLPLVAERYPPLGRAPRTPDETLVELLHHPQRMVVPELAGYPAHLHIDLLPEHQRQGLGRALIDTFLAALRRAGVSALHLGVAPQNQAALAFYRRIGFHPIDVPGEDPVVYLGLTV